ncbi:MAG: aspartate/glutamate racemase family protein [Chthoniobacterales bacterium]
MPTGIARFETIQKLVTIVENFKKQGCDGVALACTELPLVLNSHNCSLTVLDTTRILAQRAVREVLSLFQKKK